MGWTMVAEMAEGEERWYAIAINPEPWAVGPAYVVRNAKKFIPKIGPNKQLQAYQEAVRGELRRKYPDIEMIEHEVELKFYFWRVLEKYDQVMSGRTIYANAADSTNLQKGTEDALQGLLIKNDRQVICCASAIISQAPLIGDAEAQGLVVIRMSRPRDHESEIPSEMWDNISTVAPMREGVVESRNYTDPGDYF